MSESYSNIQSNGVPESVLTPQNSEMSSPNSNMQSSGNAGATPNSTPNNNTTSGSNVTSNNLPNSSTKLSSSENQPILTRPRLQELVREVDPTEQLDEEVEELLLQIADDFVEDTVKSACLYAKHRKNSKIEVKDVQLHLERKWNMWIPGFGTDELKPYKRAAITEAHKQRLALIRKTIKKY